MHSIMILKQMIVETVQITAMNAIPPFASIVLKDMHHLNIIIPAFLVKSLTLIASTVAHHNV